MGNSQGGFKEYWDLVRKYPKYQGGFIWDFVDQSARWYTKDGKEFYGYGGDFNRYDASDNNFQNNGLISPDRVPNPHAHEVGYIYQNIWVKPVDLQKGEISIYNENFFRDLSDFYAEWQLLANGEVLQSGIINDLKVGPQQTVNQKLNYTLDNICPCKEVLLNVAFKLKNTETLLPAGFAVAQQQLSVREYKAPENLLTEKKIAHDYTPTPVVEDNDSYYLIVKGENFHIDFERRSGYLSLYDVNGLSILDEGAQLTPNFWRAPTDNDMGAGLQKKYLAWKNPEIKLTSLEHATENGLVVVTAKYDMPTVSAKLTLTYRINKEGAIEVTQSMTTDKNAKVSNMFRFGMRAALNKNLSNIQYYGRGPIENYADRNNSTNIGKYAQTVDEQFYSYIRPQETGTKTDIRWWNQTNKGGNGIQLVGKTPFSASALHYTMESLDDGLEKDQRHSELVPQTDCVNFCIDKVQMGLGCVNSWGALPLDKYMVPYQDYEFTFVIKPIQNAL